ncbi:hypothetical protein KIPB_004988 [Kipferlia bialata]|uniref:SAC domain-containing protein n=1 Tax=Kipferlia bialata TaxID=797122 RepID=A0A9K3GI67_9EUKA|nr:hypothetical protein KIPB_004988 [Kipferlia bialata]|eukprot:g4988.t1
MQSVRVYCTPTHLHIACVHGGGRVHGVGAEGGASDAPGGVSAASPPATHSHTTVSLRDTSRAGALSAKGGLSLKGAGVGVAVTVSEDMPLSTYQEYWADMVGVVQGLRLLTQGHALMGVISLPRGYHALLVVTDRSHAGVLLGSRVFHVDGIEVVPLYVERAVPLRERTLLRKYISMLSALPSGAFYSPTLDVTRGVQRGVLGDHALDTDRDHALPEAGVALSCCGYLVHGVSLRTAILGHDDTCLWNKAALLNAAAFFTDPRPFCFAAFGHFSQRCYATEAVHPLTVTLVYRRSRHYVGPRFHKRGLSLSAQCANYVEGEQILQTGGKVTSFVICRGSIPLRWHQEPSSLTTVRPAIVIGPVQPSLDLCRRHLKALTLRYGSTLCLDLCKANGREQPLSTAYKIAVLSAGYTHPLTDIDRGTEEGVSPAKGPGLPVSYVHIDYSALAKRERGRGVAAQTLTSQASAFFVPTGVFSATLGTTQHCSNGGSTHPTPVLHVSSRQTGIVRVNCIDCIDRTNAMQGRVLAAAFGHQMECLGLACPHEESELRLSVLTMLIEAGNSVGLQYGGSNAHGDKAGIMRVSAPVRAITSVHRYISNTLTDAHRQCALDIVTGVGDDQLPPEERWSLESLRRDIGRGVERGREWLGKDDTQSEVSPPIPSYDTHTTESTVSESVSPQPYPTDAWGAPLPVSAPVSTPLWDMTAQQEDALHTSCPPEGAAGPASARTCTICPSDLVQYGSVPMDSAQTAGSRPPSLCDPLGISAMVPIPVRTDRPATRDSLESVLRASMAVGGSHGTLHTISHRYARRVQFRGSGGDMTQEEMPGQELFDLFLRANSNNAYRDLPVTLGLALPKREGDRGEVSAEIAALSKVGAVSPLPMPPPVLDVCGTLPTLEDRVRGYSPMGETDTDWERYTSTYDVLGEGVPVFYDGSDSEGGEGGYATIGEVS